LDFVGAAPAAPSGLPLPLPLPLSLSLSLFLFLFLLSLSLLASGRGSRSEDPPQAFGLRRILDTNLFFGSVCECVMNVGYVTGKFEIDGI
jgi:hypothetical protein